jgi:hypothetical protein
MALRPRLGEGFSGHSGVLSAAKRMPTVLQTADPNPSEYPPTCCFSIARRVNTAFCPCGVRSPGVCLVSATQVLDHVPSSPAPSHCPTAVLDPAGAPLSHRPAAANARHSPRSYMRRIVSHPGNPICTAIVHTPAKDSRASPGPVLQDWSARSCHGPATVRWQLIWPRRRVRWPRRPST